MKKKKRSNVARMKKMLKSQKECGINLSILLKQVAHLKIKRMKIKIEFVPI